MDLNLLELKIIRLVRTKSMLQMVNSYIGENLCETNNMIKTVLFLVLFTPLLTFGQVDTLKIEREKTGNSYLSNVLIDEELNIGVFAIHYHKGRLSNSYFFAIDLKEKKVVSSFSTKNWSYLYSSWIDENLVLHLSRGRLFDRVTLIALKTGNRIDDKRLKKQSKKSSSHVYVSSEDLYCTNSVVYLEGQRIYYNHVLSCFLIEKD